MYDIVEGKFEKKTRFNLVISVSKFRHITECNKAENADFQSYAAGRGYITIAMLMLSNANSKQC